MLILSNESEKLSLKHYGVSPWEINVMTSLFQKKIFTTDEEIERDYDDKYVSVVEIPIPYSFNQEL